tara:strand:+ start:399 stop:638 length:240 start_codon:yes stop_codon:yes gene_type:complete
MPDPNEELLKELMTLTVSELIASIKNGEASPSHLNVARQLLKDNQITCSIREDSPLSELVKVLPFDEYNTNTQKSAGLS